MDPRSGFRLLEPPYPRGGLPGLSPLAAVVTAAGFFLILLGVILDPIVARLPTEQGLASFRGDLDLGAGEQTESLEALRVEVSVCGPLRPRDRSRGASETGLGSNASGWLRSEPAFSRRLTPVRYRP